MDPTPNPHPPPQASDAPPVLRSKDRGRFNFEHGWWFDCLRSDWEELALPLGSRKLRILEIGSYDDTFGGSMEHQESIVNGNYELASLESRFRANVAKCEHVNKLRVIKAHSEDATIALRQEGAKFDFIYIDASHVALDVLHDAVVCWWLLDVPGTMVFDDFTWMEYNEDCYNPRIGITSFLQCAAPEINVRYTSLGDEGSESHPGDVKHGR
ncbi:hypothetical protein MMC30_007258 [Trapelia coarctata]|nr:hypothetical protein [Trapelia coarctata]